MKNNIPNNHLNIFHKVVPRIQSFSFGDEPMEAGEPSAVNCLILSGDQPMNISWLFNAAPIPPSMSDISVSQSNKKLSMLSILAVTHEHVGNYSCVVSNVAGTSVMSASLLVNGQCHWVLAIPRTLKSLGPRNTE
uniref:Down syndrome cell adhesion molecule-like protein 1 n=1 Tax=Cacopsylla melanoneura TaxID=428564 RepID=A0A8D9BD92_9HEMI